MSTEMNVFTELNKLLENVNISDVTAESSGFAELKNGYYLCEVKNAELKISKSSKKLMAAFQFVILEDGIDFKFDNNQNPIPVTLKGTKNRIIFKYYTLTDESGIRRFVADMLKFEGDEEGTPLLTKDYFTNSELIEDAFDILQGFRIYIHNDVTTKDDGTTSTWVNLISWTTASKLGLKL